MLLRVPVPDINSPSLLRKYIIFLNRLMSAKYGVQSTDREHWSLSAVMPFLCLLRPSLSPAQTTTLDLHFELPVGGIVLNTAFYDEQSAARIDTGAAASRSPSESSQHLNLSSIVTKLDIFRDEFIYFARNPSNHAESSPHVHCVLVTSFSKRRTRIF